MPTIALSENEVARRRQILARLRSERLTLDGVVRPIALLPWWILVHKGYGRSGRQWIALAVFASCFVGLWPVVLIVSLFVAPKANTDLAWKLSLLHMRPIAKQNEPPNTMR